MAHYKQSKDTMQTLKQPLTTQLHHVTAFKQPSMKLMVWR